MPYPCSSWHDQEKRKFRFYADYGIHPSLHVYGYVYAEPDQGPFEQRDLSEHLFEEVENGFMWYWEDNELAWEPVPDWIELCELPISIKA